VSHLTAAAASRLVTYPGALKLSGALTLAGVPIAGAQIELQLRERAGERTLATATTAADGSWSASAALLHNGTLRALDRGGDGARSAVVSPGVEVRVRPRVELLAGASTAPPGGSVPFSGSVAPAKRKLSLVVSRLEADGTYRRARSLDVRTVNGGFSVSVDFPAPGSYQVAARVPEDARNAAGESPPVTVAVA
jgi:hypothetical protein